MRICDAAVEVLKETDNPAVMFGDCCLIDLIAKRAERIIEGEFPNTNHQRSRSPTWNSYAWKIMP